MRSMTILVAILGLAGTSYGAQRQKYARGLIVPADADYGVPFLSWETTDDTLPALYDLRQEGLLTSVKNQGSCGSCWAFAGVAAMESAMMKTGAQSSMNGTDLSEQQIVSCDSASNGCSGGWQPFDYMIKKGVGLEADFPYAGRNLACKNISPVVKAMRWGNIGSANRRATIDEAKRALVDFGALWITVGANSNWSNVSNGVIGRCSNTQINHAVTLAGYETTQEGDQSKTRFIVKNSWGSKWADQGFVKTTLGCNNLGRHLSFVVPEGHECAPPEFGLAKKINLGRGEQVVHVPGLEQAGMDYTWFKVGSRVEGEGPIEVKAGETADYVVRTRNSCGVWTQMVQIVAR